MPAKPFALLAAVFFAVPAIAADTASTPYAIHCGHLFDANTGKLLGETTIVTDGKRIKEVKAGHADAAGAQMVELGSSTCLPGLIDSHTHLTGETSPTGYTDQFRWN